MMQPPKLKKKLNEIFEPILNIGSKTSCIGTKGEK
jgi:hypothetical protein